MVVSWSQIRRERAEDKRFMQGIRRPDRAEEALIEDAGKVIRGPTKARQAELRIEREKGKRKQLTRADRERLRAPTIKLRLGRRVARKARLSSVVKEARYRKIRR